MSQKKPASAPSATAPFAYPVDLSDLTQAGSSFDIVADAETLIRIARWAQVRAVSAFSARVVLKRLGPTRFSLVADIAADVEQSCVVTLEPIVSHLAVAIRRELLYSGAQPRDETQNHGELTLSAGDEEAPDAIDDLHYDLGGPLLEEFSLNIDPYPRREGAVFAGAGDAEAPAGPFAILETLKKNRQP